MTFKSESSGGPNSQSFDVLFVCRVEGQTTETLTIIRSCRQVEVLRIKISSLILRYLAELVEFSESLTDVSITWTCTPFIEDVLQKLERSRQLTLANYHNAYVPQFEGITDFIMKMEQLSHLHIIHHGTYAYSLKKYDYANYRLLVILRNQVNEFISMEPFLHCIVSNACS